MSQPTVKLSDFMTFGLRALRDAGIGPPKPLVLPELTVRTVQPKRGRMNERFDAKVALDTKTGCLIWTGGVQSSGYGAFKYGRHMGLAHRYAWERANGPIPEGLEIDHLCRNKRCVNVAHLEAVTAHENMLRAWKYVVPANSRKPCCPRCGSEFTVIKPWRGGKPKRKCQPCANRSSRRRYQEGGSEAKAKNTARVRAFRAKEREKRQAANAGACRGHDHP